MNLFELKRKNSLSIYRSILEGSNTISRISKVTGISQLTVCELSNELVARGILDISKPKQASKGRRTHVFAPSNKYFSIFIDVQKSYYSVIGISTSGIAVERFDYPINYEKRSKQEVFDKYVINRIRNSESFKYCMAIYLLDNSENELFVDSEIIKTSKEELIATSLSNPKKTILFEFNGKYIISLYSHLQFPSVDKELLCKAIHFDEIYYFEGDLYFEAFDSLKRIAMNNLESLI